MNQSASAPRQPGQPALTLAIPTFNRAPYLAGLLESLLPQFVGLGLDTAELLVSDNCSDDNTPEIVAAFQQRGLPCRYVRNEQNIGADGNFLQCLSLASGQYLWLIGDDDLLVPNAIPDLLSLLAQGEFDLVYISSFAFTGHLDLAALNPNTFKDKLGRYAEVVTDGPYFLEKVNALIGLISVMLVNKNRLYATPHPPIRNLDDTNLMQVGWLFPLIHSRLSVLYVWQRLVAYRSYNSGGWGICEVFGVRLERLAREYFPTEPDLPRALMNGVLRYWLCNAIIEMRRGRHAEMNNENFAADIRHLFRTNWRYWTFVYPVAAFPLPLAELVHRGLSLLNKFTRVFQALFRHLFCHGKYLQPQR